MSITGARRLGTTWAEDREASCEHSSRAQLILFVWVGGSSRWAGDRGTPQMSADEPETLRPGQSGRSILPWHVYQGR